MVKHTDNLGEVLSQKRILLGSNSLWSIYNFREGLISSFIRDGAEVLVVAPEDAYRTDLQELGCQVIPIPIQNAGLNPLREVFMIFRYARLLMT